MDDGKRRLNTHKTGDDLQAGVATGRQVRELFTRIQATVSLMMTNMIANHPYAAHLSRIEQMAQRGIELGRTTPPPAVRGGKQRTKTAAPAPPKRTESPQPAKKSPGVLLADGDDMFLNIARQMLEATGYRVLNAKTGKEVLATYREKKNAVDLIILGLVTPDTAGTVAVYEDLRRLDPDVAVLVSNGYGLDGETSPILGNGRTAFIERPFSITELSRKIRGLLDHRI